MQQPILQPNLTQQPPSENFRSGIRNAVVLALQKITMNILSEALATPRKMSNEPQVENHCSNLNLTCRTFRRCENT